MHKIYVLLDPRDGALFYVGATKRRLSERLSNHVTFACHLGMTGKLYDLLRDISRDGQRPICEIIETVDAALWEDAERYWIAYFRSLGFSLTNVAHGGKGRLGLKNNAAMREKQRFAAAGRDMSNLHTPAIRAKAAPAIAATLTGRKLSPEHCAAIARGNRGGANVGIKRSAATRSKIAAAAHRRPILRGALNASSKPICIDGRDFCSRLEAANALGVHERTIRSWVKSGRATYLPRFIFFPRPRRRPYLFFEGMTV